MKNNNILKLENLSIGYDKNIVVKNITANLYPGEIILLAGRNGCGKTTLLKTIFKEIPRISGNISINQMNIDKISYSDLGKYLSVVLSKNNASSMLKVYDLLTLGRYPFKKWYQKLNLSEIDLIEQTIQWLELEEFRNHPLDMLSEGNLQKAMIARTLVQDTDFMILDEPTSHLDPYNKNMIMKIIKKIAKEQNKAILFTSHDLELSLNFVDNFWLISEGKFITGTPKNNTDCDFLINSFSV